MSFGADIESVLGNTNNISYVLNDIMQEIGILSKQYAAENENDKTLSPEILQQRYNLIYYQLEERESRFNNIMKNVNTFIHILPIIKSQMEGLQNIIDERKMFLNNSVSLNTLQLKSIRGIEEGIGRGKIKITDPDTLEYIKSVKAEQIAKAQERQTARISSSKKQSPHSSKKGGQSKSKTRKSQKKANVW